MRFAVILPPCSSVSLFDPLSLFSCQLHRRKGQEIEGRGKEERDSFWVVFFISSAYAILVFEAGLAQLVEQLICNQQVAGSSPISSSKNEIGGRTMSRSPLLVDSS